MPDIPVRIGFDPGDRIVERDLAAEKGDQLPVAKGAHRWRLWRDATFEQKPHFLDESSLDLLFDAPVNRGVEVIPWHRQPQFQGAIRPRPLALLLRHRHPGRLVNLKGTDNAAQVGAAARRRHWIDRGQPFGQRLDAHTCRERFQMGTECRVRRNTRDLPAFDHRVDVERGAANEERHVPACVHQGNRAHRELLVERKRHLIVRIEDVNEVVRHAPALDDIGLRDTDIHTPVEVAGVGVNDLPIEAQAQLDPELRFADSGWPGNHDELRRIGRRLVSGRGNRLAWLLVVGDDRQHYNDPCPPAGAWWLPAG